ncbi:MAG TPA: ribonuclease P protein component [Miltoncostaeaceae bacterium]|nr:ribonuclease P protein component [Miltoncostaeaceae bacterium]
MNDSGPAPRRRTRITRSGDFDAVYRRGRSSANRHLVVYAFRRPDRDDDPGVRLGLSVSRKVGGAVERNRVKRVLRERFREIEGRLEPGVDLVVIARPGVAEYLDTRGSAAVGERLRELALKVAGREDSP